MDSCPVFGTLSRSIALHNDGSVMVATAPCTGVGGTLINSYEMLLRIRSIHMLVIGRVDITVNALDSGTVMKATFKTSQVRLGRYIPVQDGCCRALSRYSTMAPTHYCAVAEWFTL